MQKTLDWVILKSFTYFSNQIYIYGYFAWFPSLDTLGLRAYSSIIFPGSQEENWSNLKLFLPAQTLQGIKSIQGIQRQFTGRRGRLTHLFSLKNKLIYFLQALFFNIICPREWGNNLHLIGYNGQAWCDVFCHNPCEVALTSYTRQVD